MKATEQHINRSRQARQSSYHYRISKAVAKVAKVILIVIGAIVGLTIGSHSGAEAAALYHSLAITCHRCGVNVFDYFCDIIDRCAAWPPNTPIEKYRDLLPDRWKPSQK